MPGIPNLVPLKHGGGIPNWKFWKIIQQRITIQEIVYYTHKKSTRDDKNVRNNDVTR